MIAAVAQMDKVTQLNAASASEELNAQAEQMNTMVEEMAALIEGASQKQAAAPVTPAA